MLEITPYLSLADDEIEYAAIRAQGAGGQNVNKVSSAIHLRFDVRRSSIPEHYKERILAMRDKRLTKEGVIVIKAQQHRTQEKNRTDAILRLKELLASALVVQKTRRPTKATRGSQIRRLASKTLRGRVKTLRGRIPDE